MTERSLRLVGVVAPTPRRATSKNIQSAIFNFQFRLVRIGLWVDPPGGEGGIRTHDPAFDRILLFESRAFSRSATSPYNLKFQVHGSGFKG